MFLCSLVLVIRDRDRIVERVLGFYVRVNWVRIWRYMRFDVWILISFFRVVLLCSES